MPDDITFKGVNYPSWWNGKFASPESDAALARLAEVKGNAVAIVPTHYISTLTSHDIHATEQTESAASVAHAIATAKAQGLQVMLKPHVDTLAHDFRGFIKPDDPGAWFGAYTDLMVGYARMAQERGVELLSIGSEYQTLTQPVYAPYWNALIDAVRGVYGGKLTYAAYLGEASSVPFWGRLDYVGANIYVGLATQSNPSVDDLVAAWSRPPPDPQHAGQTGGMIPAEYLAYIAKAAGKPVLITEIGYRSAPGAAQKPEAVGVSGQVDGAGQAALYEAMFQVWLRDRPDWVKGLFLWDWQPVPTAEDATGYTPQDKPAEAVMKRWFSSDAAGIAITLPCGDRATLVVPQDSAAKVGTAHHQTWCEVGLPDGGWTHAHVIL